ncbi:MAG: divalent-cation tolerance protein CutA [Verrucomicrobiales bacterium]|nr:divalent-cation tolerance protein CutA [Verrucomicrobiales bacterium]
MNTENSQNPEANQEVRIVLVTFPNLETARQIGTLLVESQLVACVNLLPGVESIYRWEGAVTTDTEVAGFLKTSTRRLAQLEETFLREHPYDVPEFLVLKPESGFGGYLDWVKQSCEKTN